MIDDPEGLVAFEAAGKPYTAVFGFRAMKAVETHFDLPFFKAIMATMPKLNPVDLADQAKVAQAAIDIRFSDIGKLFEFALLKYHGQMAEAEIDDIIDEIGLERASEIVGTAVSSALAKEGGGEGTGNPPKRKSPRNKTG